MRSQTLNLFIHQVGIIHLRVSEMGGSVKAQNSDFSKDAEVSSPGLRILVFWSVKEPLDESEKEE